MSPRPQWLAAAVTVLLAGCMSAHGQKMQVRSELPRAEAYECLLRQVNELGYTVQEADKDSGVLSAESPDPTGMKLTGEPVHGTLTISIVEDDPRSGTQLNVTYASVPNQKEVKKQLQTCSGT